MNSARLYTHRRFEKELREPCGQTILGHTHLRQRQFDGDCVHEVAAFLRAHASAEIELWNGFAPIWPSSAIARQCNGQAVVTLVRSAIARQCNSQAAVALVGRLVVHPQVAHTRWSAVCTRKQEGCMQKESCSANSWHCSCRKCVRSWTFSVTIQIRIFGSAFG